MHIITERILPTFEDIKASSGDDLFDIFCGRTAGQYRYDLERRGLRSLWESVKLTAMSIQDVDEDRFEYGVQRLQAVVKESSDTRSLIAVHNGIGKSTEAIWAKYFSSIIPLSWDTSLGGDLIGLLNRFPNLNIVLIDDMVLKGEMAEEIINTALNYNPSFYHRVAGVFSVVMGNNEELGKNLQPYPNAIAHGIWEARNLNQILHKSPQAINDLDKNLPIPRRDYSVGQSFPLIFEGRAWEKVPDNNPKPITRIGLQMINGYMNPGPVIPAHALIDDVNGFKPFYKSARYKAWRAMQLKAKINQPINA